MKKKKKKIADTSFKFQTYLELNYCVSISHYFRMLKIVVQISYNGMTFKMLELSEETKGINFLLFGFFLGKIKWEFKNI